MTSSLHAQSVSLRQFPPRELWSFQSAFRQTTEIVLGRRELSAFLVVSAFRLVSAFCFLRTIAFLYEYANVLVGTLARVNANAIPVLILAAPPRARTRPDRRRAAVQYYVRLRHDPPATAPASVTPPQSDETRHETTHCSRHAPALT